MDANANGVFSVTLLALRSVLAARLMLFLDNVFYGEKHQPGQGNERWRK